VAEKSVLGMSGLIVDTFRFKNSSAIDGNIIE